MEENLYNNQMLEKSLDEILNPVDPQDSYVVNLYNRLSVKPEVTVEYPNFILAIAVLSTGLFLGATFIWLITRVQRRKIRI